MYPEKTITSKESHTPMFIVALFTIARTWKQPNCPSGEERIKDMWYNGILLSHKKEQNWVICRNPGGWRVCHTEWSKSEREKQVSYINAYMWNLEKWYRWTYLQSRNRDTDVEKKRMDTKGEEGMWDELGNWDWHIYTTMYKIDN